MVVEEAFDIVSPNIAVTDFLALGFINPKKNTPESHSTLSSPPLPPPTCTIIIASNGYRFIFKIEEKEMMNIGSFRDKRKTPFILTSIVNPSSGGGGGIVRHSTPHPSL